MIVSFSDFIAGSIAGMVGTMTGYPMDTLKVIQQTMNVSFAKAVVINYKYSGLRGFFRGSLFPLFTIGPSSSMLFGVYGSTLKQIQSNPTSQRVIYTSTWIRDAYLAGCTAGLVQVIGTCPIEMVKTIMQTQVKYGNIKSTEREKCANMVVCLKNIVKTDGFTGLYRGLLPMTIRDLPTAGLYMITFEYYLHDVPIIEGSLYLHQLIGGGLAGVASWIFITPFDVVKSRLQGDYSSTKENMYRGMMHCFAKTYRNEGLSVFFKGLFPICTRAFLVNAVTFCVYVHLMDWADLNPTVF